MDSLKKLLVFVTLIVNVSSETIMALKQDSSQWLDLPSLDEIKVPNLAGCAFHCLQNGLCSSFYLESKDSDNVFCYLVSTSSDGKERKSVITPNRFWFYKVPSRWISNSTPSFTETKTSSSATKISTEPEITSSSKTIVSTQQPETSRSTPKVSTQQPVTSGSTITVSTQPETSSSATTVSNRPENSSSPTTPSTQSETSSSTTIVSTQPETPSSSTTKVSTHQQPETSSSTTELSTEPIRTDPPTTSLPTTTKESTFAQTSTSLAPSSTTVATKASSCTPTANKGSLSAAMRVDEDKYFLFESRCFNIRSSSNILNMTEKFKISDFFDGLSTISTVHGSGYIGNGLYFLAPDDKKVYFYNQTEIDKIKLVDPPNKAFQHPEGQGPPGKAYFNTQFPKANWVMDCSTGDSENNTFLLISKENNAQVCWNWKQGQAAANINPGCKSCSDAIAGKTINAATEIEKGSFYIIYEKTKLCKVTAPEFKCAQPETIKLE